MASGGVISSARVAPAASRRGRLWLLAIVLLALSLAGAGVYLSLGIVAGEDPPAFPAGPFALEQDVPVSFGAFAVSGLERVNGVAKSKISNAAHGLAGYVPPNKVQVQTAVAFTNLLNRPAAYSPAQFRLVVGKGDEPARGDKRLVPTGGTFEAGTLQPNAAIEGKLTFVAPRNGSRLWLEFDDPARPGPVVVDLGKTGRTPPGAFDQFRGGGHEH